MTEQILDDLYAEEDAGVAGRTAGAAGKNRFLTPMNLIVLAITLLVIAIVAWGVWQTQLKQPEEGPAPGFSLPDVATGEQFTLSEQRGKVVVVNFWGTWCNPCRVEAPMLQRTYAAYQDQGVVFVGIAAKDVPSKVLDYIDEFGITYPNVMDEGDRLWDAYRIEAVPETFVIDTNGQITKFFRAQPPESELRRAIEEAMKS
jgi:cytochrome c biogenesis protein CcmG/thiol:disulfide interchange protein DsbE